MTATPRYRVLVTGSRTWTDEQAIRTALASVIRLHGPERVTVVHGACPRGADALADRIATAADRIATAWGGGLEVERPDRVPPSRPALPPESRECRVSGISTSPDASQALSGPLSASATDAILIRWLVEPDTRDFDLDDLVVLTAHGAEVEAAERERARAEERARIIAALQRATDRDDLRQRYITAIRDASGILETAMAKARLAKVEREAEEEW